MPQMPPIPRVQGISSSSDPANTFTSSLLFSDLYSDLTIRCSDGRAIPAHKAVLCTQSAVLANACNPEYKFKEATSGIIDLTADEPATVTALLEFFYRHEYAVPAETAAGVFHAKMYAKGDYYQVNDLKERAKSCFVKWLTDQRCSDISQKDFFPAVRAIYESTPESDRDLRDVVVEFVSNHTDIAGQHRAGTDLLAQTCPMFITDVAVAFKAKAIKWGRSVAEAAKCKHYACPSCHGKVHIDLSGFEPRRSVHCIHCGKAFEIRQWMRRTTSSNSRTDPIEL